MEGSKIDSIFTNFDLPVENARYRPFTDDKDNELRIIVGDGSAGGSVTDARYGSYNMLITPGGALAKRPSFWTFGDSIDNKRIDKMWYYESLPDGGLSGTVHTFVLASVFNPATTLWEMYYLALGTFTQFPNLRNINSSTCQHQVAMLRGLAYIKGAPAIATGELLGTIIFDGGDVSGVPTFKPWGLLGPTIPARVVGWVGRLTAAATVGAGTITVTSLTAPPAATFTIQVEYEMMSVTGVAGAGPWTLTVTRAFNNTIAAEHLVNTTVLYRNWSASAHKVNVKYGWEYTYCYKSITGQYSNRANVEFNPDMLPSNTGPFPDLIPKITVQGHADTTNIPYIVIGRTTDGGGNFAELEIIANTGAGSIVYEDKSLGTGASGTTFSDPLPDDKLKLALPMPSLTSNSPPPTVNPPQVVGVNVPRNKFSKMGVYASRIWFFIDNVLYFSGDEEVLAGIPEECFPSGVGGNFFRFADRGISIEATSASLYLFGTRSIYALNGNNKETFYVNQISAETSMSTLYPDASVAFLGRVAFVASDGRLCVITDTYIDTISEPIITPALFPNAQLVFYLRNNNQWLGVLSPMGDDQEIGYLFIYDWARSSARRSDLWFPPWTVHLNTIVIGYLGGVAQLFGATYDGPLSATRTSAGAIMNYPDGVPPAAPPGGDEYYHNGVFTRYMPTWQVAIQPFKNPPGNHINTHAIPHTTTTAHYIKLDYSVLDYLAAIDYTSNIGMRIFNDELSYTQLRDSPIFPPLEIPPSGTDIATLQTPPTRRKQSVGYVTKEWHLYNVGQDFALFINGGDISNESHVRLERLSFGLVPSAGPDSSGEKDA